MVQGGLTTCMELTAAGTPFVYVPLRAPLRAEPPRAAPAGRYGAGLRLDYQDLADPDALAEVIAKEAVREIAYRPVDPGGAARAAAMLAELL